jgi:hypothetical protein
MYCLLGYVEYWIYENLAVKITCSAKPLQYPWHLLSGRFPETFSKPHVARIEAFLQKPLPHKRTISKTHTQQHFFMM